LHVCMFYHISPGTITVSFDPRSLSKVKLRDLLQKYGMDIIENKEKQLVEDIKVSVIELIHQLNNMNSIIRKSDYLVEKLGKSYQQGLFSESVDYYNKAIILKPLSIEAKFGYVYPSSAAGNWNHTIKQYGDILEICPNNSVANHRPGLIYYERQEYSEAYKYFEKVVNLFPFDYDGLIMFGWTNYKLHRVR